jgi:hypothetical protein
MLHAHNQRVCLEEELYLSVEFCLLRSDVGLFILDNFISLSGITITVFIH